MARSSILLWLSVVLSVRAIAAGLLGPDDPLLLPVRSCDVQKFRALLDGGTDPNHIVQGFLDQEPVLLSAIENNCYGVAQLLLERGADVNGRSKGLFRGHSPLITAAKDG